MIITSTISRSLKIGLKLMGIWPEMPHPIYLLIFMPLTLFLQYFQYVYIFSHFKQRELGDLVDSLPEALCNSLTFVKMTSLWINRGVARHILATIDNDWRECDVDQHLYLMTFQAKLSHFWSNAILSLNMTAITFYLFSSYAIRALHLIESDNNTLRQLPWKIEFPFETNRSPNFELISTTLVWHAFINTFTVAIINALIVSLVFHVGGQIDIICQELKTISEKIVVCQSSARKSGKILGELIKKHNKVILCSDTIEKLFSFIALMEVAWNTLVICLLGFIVIISIHNEAGIFMLVKIILASVAILIETFIFCFAGEYLSLKGKLIAEAAYDSLWYDLPPNQAKVIALIIIRSQKRLAITAGKMMDLSFETFANIMKTSASYVSVLNAMY